jgi:hypothetical protein
MKYKVAKGMKVWKGDENSTTLFSVKGLGTLLEERRKVKTMVIEHFNSILFYKSRPANK